MIDKNPQGYDLFTQATDPARLALAWEKVRRNAGAAGVDGVTVAAFAPMAPVQLARLSRDLRDGGYRPLALRRVEIPKPGGETRGLGIPAIIDRVAQTAAAMVLSPVLEAEFEEASFAYRPGRSVRMAVDRVAYLRRAGFGWVVESDIAEYFDSIPHDRLLARLARSVPDQRLCGLVDLWLEAAAPSGVGIAQGAPISPLLANLYLDDVDARLEGQGTRLVRFADDFVILCKAERGAERALETARRAMAALGLRLHPEKTRIVPLEGAFTFLGKLFVRGMVLDAEPGSEPEAERQDALAHPRPALARPALASIEPEPEQAEGETPLRVLYVMEAGRVLTRRNEALAVAVAEAGAVLGSFPLSRIDRIELGPAARADDHALRLAVDHAIPVSFVDAHGREQSRLDPPNAHRAGLQLAQAGLFHDPVKRLDLARILVAGRITNQRALLRRLNRRRKLDAVAAAADKLARPLRAVRLADTVDLALGYEGEAATHFWRGYSECLLHGWRLPYRRRRPAPDPVNAVLGWTAGLLGRDIRALMLAKGLHPGFGVLHTGRDGADAGVYDVMEEFRSPVAEALTAYLFNNRILGAASFIADDKGGVIITTEARRAVIRAWESWLARPVASPRTGHKVGWRRVMADQLDGWAAQAHGQEVYAPYPMDH